MKQIEGLRVKAYEFKKCIRFQKKNSQEPGYRKQFMITWICLMWLEKIVKNPPNGGLIVVYPGRKQKITLIKRKIICFDTICRIQKKYQLGRTKSSLVSARQTNQMERTQN